MWCMKDSTLSVGLIKTKWNLQAIFWIRFLHLHSSRKNFSYLLVRLHLLDLSVTIQMVSPYLIITLTVMLDSWQEFNIAANTTNSCDELKDDSTPLRHSISLPNSVKTETIFPILTSQNLRSQNKFMYNNLPVLQVYRLVALSRFPPHFPV